MKRKNCCGDSNACEVPVELPEDYLDTLYQMYVRDCEGSGKSPLSKQDWLETLQ